MTQEVIIDTDPGVDDALAIMYLIKYGANISGITTIFGNADIDNTTINALKILTIVGKSIPVYKGVDKPIEVKNVFAKSHGTGGFGGYDVNLNYAASKTNAIDFLIDKLSQSDNNVTIICLGPTTNIAKLAILKPELIKKITKLIILGGVVGEKGNITPYAEFNVYNDPHALKQVLELGIDTYLIPINICRKVYFTLEDFDKINSQNMSSSIKEITKQYINYYQNDVIYGEFAGGVMYDLLAVMFYTNPELFDYKDSFIQVNTMNSARIGETLEYENITPNCKLITSVNYNRVKELFFNTMNE